MAIYYVPGEAGWNDNGTLGSVAQLRLKLETSYHAATNRSTLTVTMQARAPRYAGRFQLLNNALVELNGSTLFSGGGSASFDYYVDFAGDSAWHDLADGTSGQVCRWTATVDHAADGRATAAFSVTARLYYSESYFMTFYGLSGSQALDETRTFSLSISAATGSTVTVLRNGTALGNGAVLSYGDRLTVNFAAQSGYTLLTHTLNGASFSSGGTHTCILQQHQDDQHYDPSQCDIHRSGSLQMLPSHRCHLHRLYPGGVECHFDRYGQHLPHQCDSAH